jgi:hypothetical protein
MENNVNESRVVINLCPHVLNILDAEGKVRDFPKCETPARVSQSEELQGYILGVPVTRQKFGNVENLPEPKEGHFYVVSRIVAAAAKEEGRKTSDLLIPGPGVRDEEGKIIGAKGFSIL